MKEISIILKENRIKANLSLEQVSQLTKIQITYLEAIENGEISKFNDDVSYLKYYIRFYCRVIEFDFENIRNDLDKAMEIHTTTIQMKKINQNKICQNVINKRIFENNLMNHSTKKKGKQKGLLANITYPCGDSCFSLCDCLCLYANFWQK